MKIREKKMERETEIVRLTDRQILRHKEGCGIGRDRQTER